MEKARPKIIAVCNYKGGVGKTTTTINLAGPLIKDEKRVLVIDLDPLSNASLSIGMRLKQGELGIMEMLTNKKANLAETVWCVGGGLCDVIPAQEELATIEHQLMLDPRGRLRLVDNVIDRVGQDYEYILIDCPPSIGIFTQLALGAATDVIIPINVGYFSMDGLAKMMDLVERIQMDVNGLLNLTGVLLTKYDKRTKLSEETHGYLKKQRFPVFETPIRICIEVERAQIERKPLSHYAPACTAAQDYRTIAQEIASEQNE